MGTATFKECLKVLRDEEPCTLAKYDNAAAYIYGSFLGKHRDVLEQLMNGPVSDGDVVSKTARDDFLDWGLAVRVVVKKEQGYTATNDIGWTVYMNRPKEQPPKKEENVPQHPIFELIPVYREATKQYFVNPNKVAPRAVVLAGCSVLTAPLKFGERVDLLGLSQTEELLNTGDFDITDSIAAELALKTVYFDVLNFGVLSVDLSADKKAKFLPGDAIGRVITINKTFEFIQSAEEGQKTFHITFFVIGEVNLTFGAAEFRAKVSSVSGLPGPASVEPLGFELSGERVNLNRRLRSRVKPAA